MYNESEIPVFSKESLLYKAITTGNLNFLPLILETIGIGILGVSDEQGNTPIQLAKMNGHSEVENYLQLVQSKQQILPLDAMKPEEPAVPATSPPATVAAGTITVQAAHQKLLSAWEKYKKKQLGLDKQFAMYVPITTSETPDMLPFDSPSTDSPPPATSSSSSESAIATGSKAETVSDVINTFKTSDKRLLLLLATSGCGKTLSDAISY